jgi:protein-S-isoprenylcysteine O-methyltransferase Ste14
LAGRTYAVTGGAAVAVAGAVLCALAAVVVYFALEKPDALRAALSSPLWISAGLWIAMIVYWSKAARRIAPIRSSESAASRSRHQMLLYLGLLFLFLPFPWTGARLLPDASWVAPAGIAIQVAFMALDVWALRCLGRNWSGAIAIKVDHELVRKGPYRLVRHPIYTAMLGMYLGTAVVSGEIHGLIGFLIAVAAYVRKMRIEERGLREAFGQVYDDYARDSWWLIPWVF